MRVCFDHQVFTFQRVGGISRYFHELFRNFSNVEVKLPILFSNNSYINDDMFTKCIDVSKMHFKGSVTLFDKLNKFYNKPYLQSGKFDVFHPTYYDPYFTKRVKKPYVLTVHDMTHELFYDLISPKDKTSMNKKILVKNAEAIIAVSENTKRDIINILGLDASRIHVIYHGVEIKGDDYCVLPNQFGRYVLFVGERYSYKNFDTFLKAFRLFVSEIDDVQLICVGKPFNSLEEKLFKKFAIDNKVRSMAVDDNLLHALYSHALMFVYPSLYEGFGMPILEAFSAKCPVLTSNSSCFPEIGGDSALYFDPLNEFDIKDKMIEIVNNKLMASKLVLKGYARASSLSWEKCADQTECVYRDCI